MLTERIEPPRRLPAEAYIQGVLDRDRTMLARAITVVESNLTSDADLAAAIIEGLLPYAGGSRRVGITGVPGAGKSTLIDRLGLHLIRDLGENVAVLSVDPSSPVSRGSILGDKTRMQDLSANEHAFIRPSPARGHSGGVSRKTRETILLCEAAGYRNVLVETVGVGQSEIAVRAMTDFFLLILIPGAGDELQGIKRGILEAVDAIAINKADGASETSAERTCADYRNAVHIFPKGSDGWMPHVLTTSCVTGRGIKEVWELVLQHRATLEANGFLAQRRAAQQVEWLRELVTAELQEILKSRLRNNLSVDQIEKDVGQCKMTAVAAARKLLSNL